MTESSMNFFMTVFIHPLPHALPLSEELGIYLDNPRTKMEVDAVAAHIRDYFSSDALSYLWEDLGIWPSIKANANICNAIRGFVDKVELSSGDMEKSHIEEQEGDHFHALARLWIVARYDDKGGISSLGASIQEIKLSLMFPFRFSIDNPIINQSGIMVNYIQLLSFLAYKGQNSSVLIHDSWDALLSPSLGIVDTAGMGEAIIGEDGGILSEATWPPIRERFCKVAADLEALLRTESRGKLLYVGSLLRAANQHTTDIRMRLVTLTSILELMLTHSPDYKRFNVDESITKQFILKTSILAYMDDPTVDLDQTEKRLRQIYGQRSNVAHGNFDAIKKDFKNAKFSTEAEFLEDLVKDLYDYIRAVIRQYIQHTEFCEFIKKN
jgi:hypothetical protein